MAKILYITNWTRGDKAHKRPEYRNLAFFLGKLGHDVEALACPSKRNLTGTSFGGKCGFNLMSNQNIHFKNLFRMFPTFSFFNIPFLFDNINTTNFDMIVIDDHWANAKFFKEDIRKSIDIIISKNKYYLDSFYSLFGAQEHYEALDLEKGPVSFMPDSLCEKYYIPYYKNNPKIHQIILPKDLIIDTWENDKEDYVKAGYIDISYLGKNAPRRKGGVTFEEKLDHMRHMCPDDTWPVPHETIFANNVLFPEGNKLSELCSFGIMLRTEAYKNLAQQIDEFI
jgi:hypothetical protein